MRTVLYLVRHGATAWNLAEPALLQGRRDLPLSPLGIRQAERTRDFLAVRGIECCYSSPLQRARHTASIIAEGHDLKPEIHDGLVEADVGAWEGMDWGTIREQDNDLYQRFMKNPARHGYKDGENFAQVHERTAQALEEILENHPGEAILVVGHHVVNRVYLAGLLGLGVDQARQVCLDPCAISIIERKGDRTTVLTLNAAFHLQGLAA